MIDGLGLAVAGDASVHGLHLAPLVAVGQHVDAFAFFDVAHHFGAGLRRLPDGNIPAGFGIVTDFVGIALADGDAGGDDLNLAGFADKIADGLRLNAGTQRSGDPPIFKKDILS